MTLDVYSFQFNDFQENTFIVADQQKNCVIIDPGCYYKREEEELFNFVEEHQLKPLALLNTHAHIDHILGNYAVKNKYGIIKSRKRDLKIVKLKKPTPKSGVKPNKDHLEL